MTCQERETFGFLAEQHRRQIAVSETDLAILSHRPRQTERLQSLTDGFGCFVCFAASFLDGDCRTRDISPAYIFKADRLNAPGDLIRVDPLILADFLRVLKRSDTVSCKGFVDFFYLSVVIFKCDHPRASYSCLGSIFLTASSNLPYLPLAFSMASRASVPALMASIILPMLTYL